VDMGLTYKDLFLGNRSGSLGEVCVLVLLLGGLYLLYRKIISWHIPVTFILTVGVLAWTFGGDFLFHILSGGLVLAAVYMATDPVTSPATKTGKLIFGVSCGLLTITIRIWGGYPEGVCYAILIMNAFVPVIERIARREKT